MPETATPQPNQPEFLIQKIYTKDVSFEAPKTPTIFQNDWKPELNLNLQTKTKIIEENIHEVTLSITATVKSGENTAFVVEVHQAGIFSLKNFAKDQMGPVLGSVCPSIIFPYGREVISDLVVRGGFPQLCLAPINFDALYAQQLEHKKKQDAEKATKTEQPTKAEKTEKKADKASTAGDDGDDGTTVH